MDETQVTEIIMRISKELAAVQESSKSAHRRIDEIDRLSAELHDLAKSIAEMAAETKMLAKHMDSVVERIELGQRAQGERIGTVEKAVLTISRNEKALEKHEERLDAIEKEPGTKWEKAIWIIITGIITAIVAFFMASLLKGGQ